MPNPNDPDAEEKGRENNEAVLMQPEYWKPKPV